MARHSTTDNGQTSPAQLLAALSPIDGYRASTEELTSLRRGPLAVVPVVLAALATLIRPANWSYYTSASVEAHALTPTAWHQISQHAAPGDP